MNGSTKKLTKGDALLGVLLGGSLMIAILAIFLIAPTEQTMGAAQRIVYIHVAVAWLGLLGFVVMAVSGVLYLLRRDLAWDAWAQAAAELGWICSGLTLVTGSLWAHAAWSTWWTWDPRLMTSFVLWALYSGYLMVRANVDDPSSKSYVCRTVGEGAQPVTLQLSIPSDFVRATFNEEFFGRNFSLLDGKLVTGIPWTPGRRELKFTYVLPNTKSRRLWERPLDLPCEEVHLCVRAANPEKVSCSLGSGSVRQSGELTELSFQSPRGTLPAGHVIRVQLGHLPVPLMTHGRYLAPLILIGIIVVTSMVMIKQRRCGRPQAAAIDPPTRPQAPAKGPTPQRTRGSRRRRKRRAKNKC